MQNKIIRQYYTLSSLFSAAGLQIISAIYVTYLMKHGLNLLEVNIVNATYFFTLFVCEIPTGAFADVFGRKKSFIIACATMSLSMFVYGYSRTFTGFVLAEVLAAIALTFKSGAFKAWLVDSLNHYGYRGEFGKIFARENLLRQIAGSVGAVTGSYLLVINPSLPWYSGGFVVAITMIVAILIMREDYFKPQIISWKSGMAKLHEVTLLSMHYAKNSTAVRFVLLANGIQIFCVQALNMYWQPYFKSAGLQESRFGYLFAGMMAALSVGSYVASRIKINGNEAMLIIISQSVTAILVFVTLGMNSLWLMMLLFAVHEIPRGTWSPFMDNYLHRDIPSSERATIASFAAISPHIGGVVGLLLSGMIAQYAGISLAWLISGLSLVIGSIVLFLMQKR